MLSLILSVLGPIPEVSVVRVRIALRNLPRTPTVRPLSSFRNDVMSHVLHGRARAAARQQEGRESGRAWGRPRPVSPPARPRGPRFSTTPSVCASPPSGTCLGGPRGEAWKQTFSLPHVLSTNRLPSFMSSSESPRGGNSWEFIGEGLKLGVPPGTRQPGPAEDWHPGPEPEAGGEAGPDSGRTASPIARMSSSRLPRLLRPTARSAAGT